MERVPQNISNFFSQLLKLIYENILTYIPVGTAQILLIAIVIGIIVGVAVYLSSRKTPPQIKSEQNVLFNPTFDMLVQGRKGVDDYLNQPFVQASQNNWVLFNFAPMTVYNAGYIGPGIDGLYDTQAIRRALDLGFRCFDFHVDYYSGLPQNPTLFVPPGEPCLLHRDDQGVIRSRNCGRIDEMCTALAQQAFSPSLPTGNDPLIILLNFKNVPDKKKNQAVYLSFLKRVSEKIQPLRNRFLDRLGDTVFSGMSNPALLFTQNFQSLRGRTIIFTNVDTNIFIQPAAANTPLYQNLRSMINAQIYSLSSDPLPNDTVTQIQDKGSLMSCGCQSAYYFLTTPPDKIKDAQLKTNNVYTVINTPDANTNHTTETIDVLMNKYGAQIVMFNIYVSPQETEKYFKWWGLHSWRLKPADLQYVVVRAVPPQPISKRADANGGNVAPPPLRL